LKYKYISWEAAVELSMRLSKLVLSEYSPDCIIAISRGGLVTARIISDFSGVEDVYSIKASLWGVGGRVSDDVVIRDTKLPISGLKVLIVDDVVDTGLTLSRVVDYVYRFSPSDVRTAVLHVKPTSRYVPNYYVDKLSEWVWVIYPWTTCEVVSAVIYKELGCNALKLSSDDIVTKFHELTGVDIDSTLYKDFIHIALRHYLSKLCRNRG